MSEAACVYVSSRGLMKSCDVYPPTPSSSTRVCYDYAWDTLTPGAIVYVNSSAIPDFLRKAWPLIQVPIVLVSGDCDETVPVDVIPNKDTFRAFMEDSRLIAWYAQNAFPIHPKIRQLPIGLDYHTLSVNERHPWGPKQTPAQQEQILQILSKRVPQSQREVTAHANFQFSMNTRFAADRREAYKDLPSDVVDFEEAATTRFVTWANQAKHLFVASPQGGGVDCHRTWEALCLGCFPIVKTSFLDPLFEGLPVLIISEWKNVTPDLLQSFAKTWAGKEVGPKITLTYWLDRVRAAARHHMVSTSARPATLPVSTE